MTAFVKLLLLFALSKQVRIAVAETADTEHTRTNLDVVFVL
jgi:hypothetical protein